MIHIASEQGLVECFRPIEREEVEVPKDLRFPLVFKDYFAWVESSSFRVYLVFSEQVQQGVPMGIVFRRDAGGSSDLPKMCEWCHSVRSGNEVSLLTATANSKRRVGVHLCRDLNCREQVEGIPGIHDFSQSVSEEIRIQKVLERMSSFIKRNLF